MLNVVLGGQSETQDRLFVLRQGQTVRQLSASISSWLEVRGQTPPTNQP